jgi:hypothetical protein
MHGTAMTTYTVCLLLVLVQSSAPAIPDAYDKDGGSALRLLYNMPRVAS